MNIQPLDAAVIICCYTEDRWVALCAAIDSALNQQLPPAEVIVVVDYNPALYMRVQAQYPAVRVVANHERKGLSGARNTGISVSSAPITAFLDDDAVAEADWLARLCAPMADPQVMGVGGKLEPNWLDGFPGWLPDEFYWVVGCTYRGLPTQSGKVRNMIGGNMCIRRELFDEVGGFRSEIGRIGTIPLGGEETEFCIRAHQSRPESWFLYEPAARIQHEVPGKRTTWRYFRSRCYSEGLSKALISRLVGAQDGLHSESSYVMSVLPRGILRNLSEVLFHRDIHGLQRATVIVAGLVITTVGYLVGRVRVKPLNFPAPMLKAGDG